MPPHADDHRRAPPSLRGRLYSIAPHAPFLPTLADRILDGTLLGDWPREGAFWLSDVTIVLPTRRARLALAAAFSARGHGLLPDIRTFGGEPEDEEPFLPPHDLPPLPPAVSATERRLVLARLIEAWARTPAGGEVLATPPNAAEILGLAESLGELIDDMVVAGIPYAALRNLPPQHLDAHWQKILAFLDIAFEAWPAILAERGRADAAALRNDRLHRQAAAAPLVFGTRPVIAAGSTGSIAATADLLGAVARLPRGALVLPGLDTGLTPAGHDTLLRAEANGHGHPQYGLARLLARLHAGPGEVIELAGPAAPRTVLVRAALALADDTAAWPQARAALDGAQAADGLAVIAAATADEEARAIALCARDALSRGETVGIVSPDQNLSRRIAAELARFGVEVDDAAGTPLFQSPAGRLARLLLALAASDYGAVELVALLRHRAAAFGLERDAVRRLAGRLELCLLRGQQLRPGLAGLREALAANGGPDHRGPRLAEAERQDLTQLFDQLDAAMAPLVARQARAAGLAAALLAALDAVTRGTAPADLPAGMAELAAWAGELAAHPGQGPSLPAAGPLDGVLFALMRGQTVRAPERRRDDIFIWGLLEARLQSPDLAILAGLNEESWPSVADAGPWLSRGMRLALGLEPPERRQGQSAHDLEMAIGNRRTVLAYAGRIGTSPALPSRYLQRLTAFLGAGVTRDLVARGDVWLAGARALDLSPVLARAGRPAPRPPAAQRPRQLRITEVESLFRSPYDLYARHVLGLRRLAPLGEAPDGRDRGNIVHDVFARFVTEHDVEAPDALERLLALADEAFAALDAIAERREIWRHRFAVAARQFLDFERARQAGLVRRHAEVEGQWAFPSGFVLTGRADRVDLLADGTAEIIDFKTGAIPKAGDMADFLAPQLPLEAAMLRAGALAGLPPVEASALTYIRVALDPDALETRPFGLREGFGVTAVADEMVRRLQGHVEALLLRDDLPLAAGILPHADAGQRRRIQRDYDHLSRLDEWQVSEGDGSE